MTPGQAGIASPIHGVHAKVSDGFAIHQLPAGGGWLGICPLPRAGDMGALMDWAPDLVLSMTEMDEMVQLGAGGLGEALEEAGITWHHLPIRDFGAPPAEIQAVWPAVSTQARGDPRGWRQGAGPLSRRLWPLGHGAAAVDGRAGGRPGGGAGPAAQGASLCGRNRGATGLGLGTIATGGIAPAGRATGGKIIEIIFAGAAVAALRAETAGLRAYVTSDAIRARISIASSSRPSGTKRWS